MLYDILLHPVAIALEIIVGLYVAGAVVFALTLWGDRLPSGRIVIDTESWHVRLVRFGEYGFHPRQPDLETVAARFISGRSLCGYYCRVLLYYLPKAMAVWAILLVFVIMVAITLLLLEIVSLVFTGKIRRISPQYLDEFWAPKPILEIPMGRIRGHRMTPFAWLILVGLGWLVIGRRDLIVQGVATATPSYEVRMTTLLIIGALAATAAFTLAIAFGIRAIIRSCRKAKRPTRVNLAFEFIRVWYHQHLCPTLAIKGFDEQEGGQTDS